MILQAIKLVNYKNYASASIDCHVSANVITGRNGVGKTNLLDAIYQLALGNSNFQYQDRQLIRIGGEPFFRIEGRFKSEDDQSLKVHMSYGNETRKKLEVNGAKVEKMSDHIGRIPLVFIGPRDLFLFFDGSVQRRRLVDSSISQYDSVYLKNLQDYNRILKQRNAYLKSLDPRSISDNLLDTYDQQLAPLNQSIFKKREQFVSTFHESFANIYSEIAEGRDHASIKYKTKFAAGEFLELSKSYREKDKHLSRTHIGIHKDDFLFYVNDLEVRKFASEGQMKTTILSIKLAVVTIFERELSRKPILLLDDLFAKLDSHRVRSLLDYMFNRQNVQIFISDTDIHRISDILSELNHAHSLFEVQDGNINQIR